MTNSLDTLLDRGFVHAISDESSLRALLEDRITVYAGVDPTASSLHVGHMVPIMLLAHLQHGGHRPIVVVGGATALIGDPSGKRDERPLLAEEQVAENMVGLRAQLAHFLDFSAGACMRNNADWLGSLGYIEFLRFVGRHMSVNTMLATETYRSRMRRGGLSLLEFNYMCLQAYDFLHLYRTDNCVLQVGGSDQWANCLAGADLIRRIEGGRAYVLVSPLITTASGSKMGKTESGAVWLDPARTSPFEYFQFWVNTEDADVSRFLRLFTFLPLEQVEDLERLEGAELREVKVLLAFEATQLVHGRDAAMRALDVSRAAFRDEPGPLDGLPSITLASAGLQSGISITELLVLTGFCQSRSEARRLIAQGGVSIDGSRLQDWTEAFALDDIAKGAIIRVGKKRIMRVLVQ